MGIEAREQVRTQDGFLEDTRITRSNHPLVKYAEAFTHNFDLIAERRSAIFHLRELAKASVLAKFLVEGEVHLEDGWFDLAEKAGECQTRIPQLWNDRRYATITVQSEGGEIASLDTAESISGDHSWGIYGGVEFGLDKISLGTKYAPASLMQSISVPAGAAVRGGLVPAGVDLNLDKFSVFTAQNSAEAWGAGVRSSEPCPAVGKAFWAGLAGKSAAFTPEDQQLLSAVFHPRLSDRRDEGDLFVAPSTSAGYLEHLRGLVAEEESVKQRRKAHFLSAAFSEQNAGKLFPAFWTDSIAISTAVEVNALSPRPDYKAKAHMFEDVLKSSVPGFDKSTEEGSRFRIYRCGNLEVRTLQEHGKGEEVGAVFSSPALTAAPPGAEAEAEAPVASRRGNWSQRDGEKIVKVTLYVERDLDTSGRCRVAVDGRPQHRSYVVLETEQGASIVTEKLADGRALWQENPEDMASRNSLAKVLRSSEGGTLVKDAKSFWLVEQQIGSRTGVAASSSKRKCYAQGVFKKACGRRAN
jgi:hypothetical protein